MSTLSPFAPSFTPTSQTPYHLKQALWRDLVGAEDQMCYPVYNSQPLPISSRISDSIIFHRQALEKYEDRLITYARERAFYFIKALSSYDEVISLEAVEKARTEAGVDRWWKQTSEQWAESVDVKEPWWATAIYEEENQILCQRKWLAAFQSNDWTALNDEWRQKISQVEPKDDDYN